MYPFTRREADHFLAVLAQEDAFLGDVGMFFCDTDDVAARNFRVKAE